MSDKENSSEVQNKRGSFVKEVLAAISIKKRSGRKKRHKKKKKVKSPTKRKLARSPPPEEPILDKIKSHNPGGGYHRDMKAAKRLQPNPLSYVQEKEKTLPWHFNYAEKELEVMNLQKVGTELRKQLRELRTVIVKQNDRDGDRKIVVLEFTLQSMMDRLQSRADQKRLELVKARLQVISDKVGELRAHYAPSSSASPKPAFASSSSSSSSSSTRTTTTSSTESTGYTAVVVPHALGTCIQEVSNGAIHISYPKQASALKNVKGKASKRSPDKRSPSRARRRLKGTDDGPNSPNTNKRETKPHHKVHKTHRKSHKGRKAKHVSEHKPLPPLPGLPAVPPPPKTLKDGNKPSLWSSFLSPQATDTLPPVGPFVVSEEPPSPPQSPLMYLCDSNECDDRRSRPTDKTADAPARHRQRNVPSPQRLRPPNSPLRGSAHEGRRCERPRDRRTRESREGSPQYTQASNSTQPSHLSTQHSPRPRLNPSPNRKEPSSQPPARAPPGRPSVPGRPPPPAPSPLRYR